MIPIFWNMVAELVVGDGAFAARGFKTAGREPGDFVVGLLEGFAAGRLGGEYFCRAGEPGPG